MRVKADIFGKRSLHLFGLGWSVLGVITVFCLGWIVLWLLAPHHTEAGVLKIDVEVLCGELKHLAKPALSEVHVNH